MKLGILPAIGLVGLLVITDLRICEINKRLDALEQRNYVTGVKMDGQWSGPIQPPQEI